MTAGVTNTANVSLENVKYFVDRAKDVSQLRTKRQQPRMLKVNDTDQALLSPLDLQTQNDFRRLFIFKSNSSQFRNINEDDWIWFINTCMTKLTTTHTSLAFSQDQYNILYRFISIAKTLLPAKNWLIAGSSSVIRRGKPSKMIEGFHISSSQKGSTIYISIYNRDEKVKYSKWEYSPLISFFTYIVLVSDEKFALEL